MTVNIDPQNVTKYDRDDNELQTFWLYCIMSAGRKAKSVTASMEKLLKDCQAYPLTYLLDKDKCARVMLGDNTKLDRIVRKSNCGQYGRITRAIRESSQLCLHTADVQTLAEVYGVGQKISRFFVTHSREGVNVATLDHHIISWLRQWHPTAPCPVPPIHYELWEDVFLGRCLKEFPGQSIADVDLRLRKEQRDGQKEVEPRG